MQTGWSVQRAVRIIWLRYWYIIVRLISWGGEVNERLIVRAACNETNCLWAVCWPQSIYCRTLQQVRHFRAVENWDLVLKVFGKLRYTHHTPHHTHTDTHTHHTHTHTTHTTHIHTHTTHTHTHIYLNSIFSFRNQYEKHKKWTRILCSNS